MRIIIISSLCLQRPSHYMGAVISSGSRAPPPERPDVIEGMVRVCVIGFHISHNTSRAVKLAEAIVRHAPNQYELMIYTHNRGYRGDKEGYHRDKTTGEYVVEGYLKQIKSELSPEQQAKFAAHKTSPFCWLETVRSQRCSAREAGPPSD